MPRVTLSGPSSKVMSATLGGAPDATLKEWWDFAKGQKTVEATTDLATGTSTMIVESDDLNSGIISLAISQGFTVTDAPVFVKMSVATYANPVPDGLGNREKPDSSIRTWSEWHDATHNHMDATDGDKIVPGNSFGVELTSAELAVLLAGGYTLLTASEVAAHLPSEEEV